MNVRIIPKCKRAKERVKQHGSIMRLLDSEPSSFLVESLKETASGNHFWTGWFTFAEADYNIIDNN